MASNVEPPSAADSRVSKSTMESAVAALLKYKAAQSTTQKLQLLPQDDYIYLNLTLKKLPPNSRTNPYKIPLSNPILDAASQLCLIIDDRPKSTTPPSDQIKKLIKSQNIPISKVIKISKLKTNYKPFEAKRKLCDSYDLFLVDKRVVHLLPKLLGKQFFKKKKLPLGVDMGKKNLKLQVERAIGSALLYVRSGTCCVMKVGKVEMEKDEIVENVFDAIKGAVERVQKKWDGVRSLHLKFCDSVALPIYQAMPDVRLRIEGLKEIEDRAELAKISDIESDVKEMSGKKGGKSGKKKNKGRISEVRYMDVGEDMDSDDEDENEEVRTEDIEESVGLKGMDESDDNESNADETKKIEKEELSIDESVGKKRKKDKASKKEVPGVVNEQKPEKKKVKPEKTVGRKRKKDDLSSSEEPKKVKPEKTVGRKRKEDGLSSSEEPKEVKPEKSVGRKTKEDGLSSSEEPKEVKPEKTVGRKTKKDGLSKSEESAEMKGKKKSELGRKPNVKVKDAKSKKRLSAK